MQHSIPPEDLYLGIPSAKADGSTPLSTPRMIGSTKRPNDRSMKGLNQSGKFDAPTYQSAVMGRGGGGPASTWERKGQRGGGRGRLVLLLSLLVVLLGGGAFAALYFLKIGPFSDDAPAAGSYDVPGSYLTRIVLEASGTVSDFTAAQGDAVASAIADRLSVAQTQVVVTVAAGSIIVTAEVE